MFSRLLNADTSITKVDLGKWKLVIKPSIALYVNPGYIKISVHPLTDYKFIVITTNSL